MENTKKMETQKKPREANPSIVAPRNPLRAHLVNASPMWERVCLPPVGRKERRVKSESP
jgi:hypothetical protein